MPGGPRPRARLAHQGVGVVAVLEPEGMADLVGDHVLQVGCARVVAGDREEVASTCFWSRLRIERPGKRHEFLDGEQENNVAVEIGQGCRWWRSGLLGCHAPGEGRDLVSVGLESPGAVADHENGFREHGLETELIEGPIPEVDGFPDQHDAPVTVVASEDDGRQLVCGIGGGADVDDCSAQVALGLARSRAWWKKAAQEDQKER